MVCPETSHFSTSACSFWGLLFLLYVMRHSIRDIWSFSTIDSLNNRHGRDQVPDTVERSLTDFYLFIFCRLFLMFLLCGQNRNQQSQWVIHSLLGLSPATLSPLTVFIHMETCLSSSQVVFQGEVLSLVSFQAIFKRKGKIKIYRTSQNVIIKNVFLESLLSESFPSLGSQSTSPP